MIEYSEEIQNFIQNYNEKYENNCVPVLQKYENKRKLMLLLSVITTIALILAGVFVLYTAYPNIDKGDVKIGGGLILFGFFGYYIFKKMFESTIKEKVMEPLMNCFGDIQWSQFYQGDPYAFVKAGLFPNFTSKEYDDVFKCKYKDVNIDIVESEYSIDGGNSENTVFKGVVIKLEMNKEFNGHTLLCSKSLFAKSPLKSLTETKMEDVEFNKLYNIYTDDEVEARYVLTTSFIERLKNINLAFKCKNTRCAFRKNNLYIALSTNQDLFSVGSLIKPVADKKQFEDLCNQFASILALVDTLKLNIKTGL